MAQWTKKQFRNAILAEADHHGVDLDATVVEQLLEYHRLLEHWNRRIRLVGRSDARTFVQVHLSDALALVAALGRPEVGESPDPSLLDVGSGAGLPGLLVALCGPRYPVTLCEVAHKRVAFLQEAIRQVAPAVELQPVAVQRCVEQGLRYHHVVSRAVFEPAEWQRTAKALVRPKGWIWTLLTRKQYGETPDLNATLRVEYRLRDSRDRVILGSCST